jgi:hypothetical protein
MNSYALSHEARSRRESYATDNRAKNYRQMTMSACPVCYKAFDGGGAEDRVMAATTAIPCCPITTCQSFVTQLDLVQSFPARRKSLDGRECYPMDRFGGSPPHHRRQKCRHKHYGPLLSFLSTKRVHHRQVGGSTGSTISTAPKEDEIYDFARAWMTDHGTVPCINYGARIEKAEGCGAILSLCVFRLRWNCKVPARGLSIRSMLPWSR